MSLLLGILAPDRPQLRAWVEAEKRRREKRAAIEKPKRAALEVPAKGELKRVRR